MKVLAQSHSAAPQALGYVHQCNWALVELAKRTKTEPATQLRLETMDDIQFDSVGEPTELLQTKHHTRTSSPITAHAVDLWRTLNVWMNLALDDKVVLRLITNRTLGAGSSLIRLREGADRDPYGAIEELLEAARESTNQATAKWRQKFLELGEPAQVELIDRIIICDESPNAGDIDEELIREFRFVCPLGQEKIFLEQLKGWWSGVSVQLLSNDIEVVTGYDLQVEVTDIRNQLSSNTLPVDPSTAQAYDETIANLYRDRTFVEQLVWIGLDSTRLWKAIRDYHRSSTQRAFWLRNQHIAESELDRFASKLHDEWEHVFDSRVAVMKRERRGDLEVVGQEILEELSGRSQIRIRENFEERWFSRGMLHELADGKLRVRIGWHPDFESKLKALLGNG